MQLPTVGPMSTGVATVSTTHPRTFGHLVRTRRDNLGLTRKQTAAAGLQPHDLITVYQLASRVPKTPKRAPQNPAALRTHTVPRKRPGARRHRPIPHIPQAGGSPIPLREYRIVLTGWSLDDAAMRLTEERRLVDPAAGPVTRGTMSAIETGQRGMSIEMAHALERIYQLEPGTLAGQIRGRHAAAR